MLGLLFALAGSAHGAPTVQFGAYAPPAPGQGMGAVTELEGAIGQPLEIVGFYQAWGGPWAEVQVDWLNAASAGGQRKVLLTWEPWAPGGPARQPEFALNQIVSGRHDAYIRRFARQIAAWGGRVYLRPMHEVNGDWYPWAGGIAGNSPDLYVRAWRRMYRLFAIERARNVVWVWSPNVNDVPVGNRLEAFYPGRGYVDLLALDGYNWGAAGPGGWRTFDQVFRAGYQRVAALGPQPIWIAEIGSAGDGGDKAAWVRQTFRAVRSARYPRITAVVWFHMLKERDWRATSGPGVAATFRSELALQRAALAPAGIAGEGPAEVDRFMSVAGPSSGPRPKAGTAAGVIRAALAWTLRIRRLPEMLARGRDAGLAPRGAGDRAI